MKGQGCESYVVAERDGFRSTEWKNAVNCGRKPLHSDDELYVLALLADHRGLHVSFKLTRDGNFIPAKIATFYCVVEKELQDNKAH